ncbi:unnamed protein product [Adineta steineri]|uniref:Transmembrane protein 144 n=1 Tax=Adineta steineri TaxID=433720 RepID=A0A819KIL5_9BILA|nr:unnamed protein product [Adineta steineri]CAF3947973.1 unnamed protein product [Adineta steineri]
MDWLLTTSNTTTLFDSPSFWTGSISVAIAIFFFGSSLVPAAKYRVGDGLSFQFFLCVGVWITGAIVNLIVKNPPFFPLVMIGGMLWATGNILSIYVITINGLGLSMLLWSTTNKFVGKTLYNTSGHFGWFGLKPEEVEIPVFNYLGVKRIIDCSLAIVAGTLFGLVFTPSTYIQNHQDKYPGAIKNGLNYIFAMYTGILLTSSVYYGIYLIFKRNRPYICIESILPAFISGIMCCNNWTSDNCCTLVNLLFQRYERTKKLFDIYW